MKKIIPLIMILLLSFSLAFAIDLGSGDFPTINDDSNLRSSYWFETFFDTFSTSTFGSTAVLPGDEKKIFVFKVAPDECSDCSLVFKIVDSDGKKIIPATAALSHIVMNQGTEYRKYVFVTIPESASAGVATVYSYIFNYDDRTKNGAYDTEYITILASTILPDDCDLGEKGDLIGDPWCGSSSILQYKVADNCLKTIEYIETCDSDEICSGNPPSCEDRPTTTTTTITSTTTTTIADLGKMTCDDPDNTPESPNNNDQSFFTKTTTHYEDGLGDFVDYDDRCTSLAILEENFCESLTDGDSVRAWVEVACVDGCEDGACIAPEGYTANDNINISTEDENEWCLIDSNGKECYPKKEVVPINKVESYLDKTTWEGLFEQAMEDGGSPLCTKKYGDIQCQDGGICLIAKDSTSKSYKENKIIYDAIDENSISSSTWLGQLELWKDTLLIKTFFNYDYEENLIEEFGACVPKEKLSLIEQFMDLTGIEDKQTAYIVAGILGLFAIGIIMKVSK